MARKKKTEGPKKEFAIGFEFSGYVRLVIEAKDEKAAKRILKKLGDPFHPEFQNGKVNLMDCVPYVEPF